MNSRLTSNNLGGQGPNLSDKHEIRYADVADEIDLVLTIDEANQAKPYAVNNGAESNGLNGKFGQVNVLGGTSVAMKFTLVEAGTDIPVIIAPEQIVFFSVFDMDYGGSAEQNRREFVDFTTPVDSFSVTKTTTVLMSGNKDSLRGVAGRFGTDLDNPTDPLALTQLQKDSTIWVTYKGRNTWGMTFGETNNAEGKGGRNLLFAGRGEGNCPPGPVPFPTGSCSSGLEGMVKNGGRVCCQDACGNSTGSYAKFSGAPNACGGPNCEKGIDGLRSPDRYDNCCVGKPIIDGSIQSKISSPYGIVHQGRFCAGSGMGSDVAPCINKLPRAADEEYSLK